MAHLPRLQSSYIPMASAGKFSTVFIDFDGTIADNDVTDVLLMRFAAPSWRTLEEEWLHGRIGARQCMAEQIRLLDVDPQSLDMCLDEMTIDADFPAFVKQLTQEGVRVAVVSDGIDYGIRHILNRYGLSDITVFANRLVYCGDQRWQLHFPYGSSNCPSGHCKCRRFDDVGAGSVVYIGDGTSDYCPAQKADLVLAKDKLARYCQYHSIDHIRVQNFSEIIALWPDLSINKAARRVAS